MDESHVFDQEEAGKETWVQCDNPDCQKWRKLPFGSAFPDADAEWFCHLNADPEYNSCDVPEEKEEEEVTRQSNKFKVNPRKSSSNVLLKPLPDVLDVKSEPSLGCDQPIATTGSATCSTVGGNPISETEHIGHRHALQVTTNDRVSSSEQMPNRGQPGSYQQPPPGYSSTQVKTQAPALPPMPGVSLPAAQVHTESHDQQDDIANDIRVVHSGIQDIARALRTPIVLEAVVKFVESLSTLKNG